ncbi:MAG: TIM barrel protein, partial [Armatimonadota bacterium]
MRISQVAAQLYTVREHIKTPTDLAAAFRKIRQVGYQAVQLSAVGAFPEEDVAKMLADTDLVCCSTHEDSSLILNDPHAVVERLRKYGTTATAYPYPGGVKLDTLDDVKAFAAKLNAAGRVLHEAGMLLAYHNHNIEFRRFDGRLMLDVLYEETDPRYLQGEPDTYWIQYGGGDSEDWCRALKNRLPLLHLKDYQTRADESPTFAEIGRGNLNWKPIIAAAEEGGCQWYIVEQDRCDG